MHMSIVGKCAYTELYYDDTEAAMQVIECRRVLQWTYVFGFYLEDGPEKFLFEFLQENLEKNSEHLHELVERPLDAVS